MAAEKHGKDTSETASPLFMEYEIPSILPSEIHEIAFGQIRGTVVEHTKLFESQHDVRKPYRDTDDENVGGGTGPVSDLDDVVQMVDDVRQEEYFEDVGGEVVMQEESSVHEEVGEVVDPVSEVEDSGGVVEVGERARRQRLGGAPAQRRVQRAQRREHGQRARAAVPRHQVADQVDLRLRTQHGHHFNKNFLVPNFLI